jgi:hypothetical protein
MIRAFFMAMVATLLIGLVLALAANAAGPSTNEGGSGGGYQQLPTCGAPYYGTVLYVQGYLWRCVRAAPDHWVLL